MRRSETYRGAKRNMARRAGLLGDWRKTGTYVDAANAKAKLGERVEMANKAREAAAKAVVDAGYIGWKRQADVALAALITVYGSVGGGRSMSRIKRDLAKQKRVAAHG